TVSRYVPGMRPNVDIIKKVLSLIPINPKIKQRTSFGKPGNRKSKKQITAPVLVEMKSNLSRMSFLTNLSIKGLPKISAISKAAHEPSVSPTVEKRNPNETP